MVSGACIGHGAVPVVFGAREVVDLTRLAAGAGESADSGFDALVGDQFFSGPAPMIMDGRFGLLEAQMYDPVTTHLCL